MTEHVDSNSEALVAWRRPVTFSVLVRSVQMLSWFSAYLAILTLVLGPFLWLWCRLFDHQHRLPRKLVRMFYRHAMRRSCKTNLRIKEFDWSAISGSCILVSNHQSSIDVLLMFQLPPDARCWSKEWPFHRPLLGWLMALCGHLHVDDPDVLDQAAEGLRRGIGIYIFPEGTRSRSHRLGRFHDGAFLLACKANIPIVAVAIHGSGDCMPPGEVVIFDVPLLVEPLGVLYPDPSLPHPHRELKKRTWDMIAAALDRGPDSSGPGKNENTATVPTTAPRQPVEELDAAGEKSHG